MSDSEKILSTLTELLRKAETGEITSLVVVAGCSDGVVLSRVSGEILPPHGTLILQDIANESRALFLGEHNGPDPGGPRLAVVAGEPDDATKAMRRAKEAILDECDELDCRARNIVQGIQSPWDLSLFRRVEVKRRHGCGDVTMARLSNVLKRFGLEWATTRPLGVAE